MEIFINTAIHRGGTNRARIPNGFNRLFTHGGFAPKVRFEPKVSKLNQKSYRGVLLLLKVGWLEFLLVPDPILSKPR